MRTCYLCKSDNISATHFPNCPSCTGPHHTCYRCYDAAADAKLIYLHDRPEIRQGHEVMTTQPFFYKCPDVWGQAEKDSLQEERTK